MKATMIITAMTAMMFAIMDFHDGIIQFNGNTLMAFIFAFLHIFFYAQYAQEKNTEEQ